MKSSALWSSLGLLAALALFAAPPVVGQQKKAAAPKSAIGSKTPTFELRDFRGKQWTSAEVTGERKFTVVAFLGTECPLVKQYAGRLERMHQQFKDRVAFVGLNSNQQDSLTEIAHFTRVNRLTFPMLKDAGNRVADQFSAERTPEVFVLDDQRRVRYHGRIDDQHTYGIQKPKVKQAYLQKALEQLLAGQPVEVTETEVVGCHIGRLLKAKPDSKVTYGNQISRVLQRRCVSCHRPGEIAPFALTDYDEVVGWAEMIAEVVDERRMPPWHANPEHGSFSNDAKLSDNERELILEWVENGAPRGDLSKLPEPLKFTDGWSIGKPDLIVKMSDKPFRVKAEGEVRYQYFVVDPGFEEDKWIKAAECRPGNRSVVHHILVTHRSRERRDNRRSAWLAANAPGSPPLILKEGQAKRIPAGSKLVFQLHYTPNGTAQEDLSSIGFIFVDPKDVKHEVMTKQAANNRFRIPPGADNHEVRSSYSFQQDSKLLSLFPHMHLRGKSFRYTAVFPNGKREILLDVPHYDFNWQNGYRLTEPLRMPRGSRLECVAHFDNSEGNLANPNPNETVRWGDQTWEEMMIGYFDIIHIDEDLTSSRKSDFLGNLKEIEKQKAEFVTLAGPALQSDKALLALLDRVRKVAPQVDRIDWIHLEGEKQMRVARSAPVISTIRSGLLPSGRMKIAEYARKGEVVVNQKLSGQSGLDLRVMSRMFKSSLHAPLTRDGKKGVVSFWSTDGAAFPREAVDVLTKLVKQMK